jgi:hypothetical protein
MTENNIIEIALTHYDETNEKYKSMFKNVKYYKTLGIDKDLKKDKINFYDKNDKLIISADYEVCSCYYKDKKLWIWAWGIIALNKNKITTAKSLLDYGLNIDIKNTLPLYTMLKSNLITSRFQINNNTELDIYLSLSLYLSKKKMIYKADINNIDFTQYLYLDNIKKHN